MQAYNMKDSGVEVLADIPTHWEAGKIKNGFYLKPSNVDKKTHDDEIAVELCNYVDVYYNDFIVNKLPFMEATAKQTEIDKFSLQIDDVIITKDSEDPMDIGVPALVKENKPNLVCGYHLTMLKKRLNNVSGAFLFWVLKDSAIASQLYREATGVTRWAISSRNIKNVSIPYPSYDEQKTIASYLDKACEKIDKTLFIKQQQLDKLEAYRKSIIHEAVTKGLDENVAMKDSAVEWVGDIPEHWSIQKLRYYLTLQNGKLINNEEFDPDGKYPIYGGNGVLGRSHKFNYADEILILGRVGAKCGNVHFTVQEIWVSDNAIAVKTNQNYLFFYYLLKDMNLNHIASDTAQPLLVGNNVKKLYFPLPKINEQKAIANYLEKACKKIDKTKAVIESQITTLSQYRQSLIHESVTGKKRIYQDDIN